MDAAKAMAKERLHESYGEALEEGFQDVAGALGSGYYDYAYQDYIDSRFGDNGNINTATTYSVLGALSNGLTEAAKSTVSDETLMDAFYGGLSTVIGGFNVNTNRRNSNINENASTFRKALDKAGKLNPARYISWRGAWTPFVQYNEVNRQMSADQALAAHVNEFFNDKEIQDKILSAGGMESYIKQYNDAIESGDEFITRNAKFGQVFTIANMLDKLKGTAYHDMVTNSLDKRIALGQLTDNQIKQQLNDPDSDASQVLKEYKSQIPNVEGNESDKDFSASDDNVATVKKISKNANQMKDVLDNVAEKREQIQKDFGAELDDDGMDAMLYQQLSIDNKQKRRDEIDEKLQEVSSFDKDKQANSTSKKAVATHGSLENLRLNKEKIQSKLNTLNKLVQDSKEDVDKAKQKQEDYNKALKKNKGKETPEIKKMAPTFSERQMLNRDAQRKERISQYEQTLKLMEKQDSALSKSVEARMSEMLGGMERSNETTESTPEIPVLSEKDIMELDAATRAFMLSEKNKGNYSEKQQEIIDALNAKGRKRYGKDWDAMITDASRLEFQINRDTIRQNAMILDSSALNDHVHKAKIARLKRDRTNRYEPLFIDARTAMRNYDENVPESAE